MKFALLILLLGSHFQVFCENPPPRLFEPVSQEVVQKIKAYNIRQVSTAEYLSLKSRIVKVDTKMLVNSKSFTFKPFSDVTPVVFVGEPVQGYRKGIVNWVGKQRFDLSVLNSSKYEESEATKEYEKNLSERFPESKILLAPWDVDSQGVASLAARNVFRHSKMWSVGPDGSVFFDEQNYTGADSVQFSDPPKTPEDIAHHRKMKSLGKNAFRSAIAEIRLIDITTGDIEIYRLQPLRYTPMYSILTLRDPSARYKTEAPVGIEKSEAIAALKNNEKWQKANEKYNKFIQSLPEYKENKKVLGSIKK